MWVVCVWVGVWNDSCVLLIKDCVAFGVVCFWVDFCWRLVDLFSTVVILEVEDLLLLVVDIWGVVEGLVLGSLLWTVCNSAVVSVAGVVMFVLYALAVAVGFWVADSVTVVFVVVDVVDDAVGVVNVVLLFVGSVVVVVVVVVDEVVDAVAGVVDVIVSVGFVVVGVVLSVDGGGVLKKIEGSMNLSVSPSVYQTEKKR